MLSNSLLFLGIDFKQIFQNIFVKFGDAVPGIIGALIVFIIGWIVAKIVARLVKKLLEKVGIDKFADNLNDVDLFSKMKVQIKPSSVLSKISYYLLLLVTMMVSAEVSGLEELSNLMEKIIDFAPKVLSAFIISILGLVISDFIRKMVVTACDSVGIPSGRILGSFIFYFLFITILITALKQIGIPTELISTNITLIIAGIVIAFAIGYGFASRTVLASLLSSFFYAKGKLNIGDKLKVGENQGKIINMDSTSVTILKENKNQVIIPLSKLAEEEVEILN